MGAAVGVWAAVTKGLDRRASIVIDKGRSMATTLINAFEHQPEYENMFITPQEALDRCTQRSLLIVVDTHSTSFVESQEVLKAIPRVVVIDHHRMMVTHIENAIIFYHEPYASSASEMVAELVQYINSSALNKKEATALLSGIMLDTKNFVLKTGVRTFEASAYLKRRGADTVEVKKMFANSLDTYKERSQLVAGAEVYKGCAIACSNWEFPNVRIAAAQAADELLSIQGVRASFVIFRVGNEIAISARSLGDVNVQILLEEFGGGGHLNMAGAQIKNSTTNDVRKALIRVLDEKTFRSDEKRITKCGKAARSRLTALAIDLNDRRYDHESCTFSRCKRCRQKRRAHQCSRRLRTQFPAAAQACKGSERTGDERAEKRRGLQGI